ncbi:MAG: GPW/gp25 family protein [Saprospiraceae bacterium]
MTCYPINNIFHRLTLGETLLRISEVQSIRDHIYVLLSTVPNEYLYDRQYGCELLNSDFNIERVDNEKESIYLIIKNSIIQYEPRIDPESFKAEARIETEEKNNTLRKKLILSLSMDTKDLKESLSFDIFYYLSPFALA